MQAQEIPEGLRLPKHGNVYVVAHRGAHDGIPENTLAAYRRAIDLECDFVEIDVRTTKDNHLVSIHDASIDRYTIDGSKGVVAEMTLAQLQAVDVGSRVDPKWKEERVPTVDAILRLCKGRIGIYLDVKASSIESLHRLVREHEMDSDTLWYIPQAKVQELRDRSTRCWPMPDPGPEIFLASLLKEQKPKTVASAAKFFSSTFAEACHQTGAIVIVDENGRDSWNKLLADGADGIQTDSPAELISYLKNRNRKK